MISVTLLTTLLCSLAIAAKPIVIERSPVTLPLSRRVNATGISNLLAHDQSRAKALKRLGVAKAAGHSQRAVISESIENRAVSYVAHVGIGSPPTTCKYRVYYASPSLTGSM